jgi:hypothetical protein
MGKNKVAVGPKSAVESDGMGPGAYIEASIKSSGLPRDEWFKRFNQGIANTGYSGQVTDGPSFQSYLDNQYATHLKQGVGVSNDGYGTKKAGVFADMLTINKAGHTKNFLYDSGWQYKASLKFPVSYIDASGHRKTKFQSADLTKANYLARKLRLNKKTGVLEAADGGHVGDIYRVWDPQHPDNFTYAMLGDGGPDQDKTVTEVSASTATSLGPAGYVPDPNNSIPGVPTLACQRLGPNTMPQQGALNSYTPYAPMTPPTNEQIQRDGQIYDWKFRLKPEAPKSGGAFQLLHGEDTVLLGPDTLPAGYADATCIHTGGGHIAEGSGSVFVGKGLWPLARVDDSTSDGYFVTTGATTVEAGD